MLPPLSSSPPPSSTVNNPVTSLSAVSLTDYPAMNPLLTRHTLHYFQGHRDPLLSVTLNGQPTQLLLDSGAHVSVLSQNLMEQLVDLPQDNRPQRPVKAFGGRQLNLEGPVSLDLVICGICLRHPFYYVAGDVPAIAGYDLMVAAHLVLDPKSRAVWSHHPDVTQVQEGPSITFSGEPVSSSVPTFPHGTTPMSQATHPVPEFSASNGIVSMEQSDPSIHFDPTAPPFIHGLDNGPDTSADDSVPDHLNLLYETTVSNTKLTVGVDKQFRQLLNKHSETFAKSNYDLGQCTILEHDIDTGEAPPIKQSPRRPPLSSGNAEEQIIQDMLNAGVIQPSTSSWASPVCLVKKHDGTFRFCIDYRRVNAVTKRDAFPTPDVSDALDSLRGSQWFATIDLLNGYWQLKNTPRARERSAFCTKAGLFEFLRMPFGLSGAPATFCRVMTRVMSDLLWKICISYIDDLIIFARSRQELLERLDIVLTRLRQFGLKVKPSKCVLFRTEVNFLGHLVNSNGVQPLPDKVEAIQNWPTPRCIRDVRSFYGLLSYYRKFIQNFATVAEPLTRMTKKNVKFLWSLEADKSFRALKNALLQAPILAYPYPDRPCLVDTDCSEVAYGAALSQLVDGVERPVAFFSRVLNSAQANYCATKRELLAVVAALQHFRHYLLNVKVILRTDHHSLKWIKSFKRPEGLLARWLETLSEFDLTIEHRPGRIHCNADSLSRRTCKQCWGRLPETAEFDELERADECTSPLGMHALHVQPELSDETVAELQDQDVVLRQVKSWLESSYSPTVDDLRECPPQVRKLWSMRQQLQLTDDHQVLTRTDNSVTQIVIPEVLQRRLFEAAHSGPLAAHLGHDRTLAQLKRSYYWPGMSSDIRLWIHACEVCARARGPPSRYQGPLHKVIAAAPMDLVAIDILCGLPVASDGSTCILVAQDYFSKWTEAYSLKNEEASTCMEVLYNQFFSRFGFPAQLHSDQGRQFESRLVTELAKITGVRKTRTTAYHARSDGAVERFNRTLLSMLRTTALENPHEWPAKLPAVTSAYRMTPHATTGVSPNLIMLGRELRAPCTLIARPPDETDELTVPFTRDFLENMRQAHHRVRTATQASAKTQKSFFDARIKAISLSVNDLVYLYTPQPLLRQRRKKLTPLWLGPYKVTEFVTDVVVKIQHIATKKCQTVHVDRLAPCRSIPQIISTSRPQSPHPSSSSSRRHRQKATVDQPSTVIPPSLENQSSSQPVADISNKPSDVNRTITKPRTRLGRVVQTPVRFRT